MYYGVSYYPEQKTPEELEHDLELLLRSGINTVRMGEFSWCRMEPSEGVFDFGWLDRVIERLGRGGIRTIVCTPTAAPPAWLVSGHPDVLYQDNRGIRRPYGGRRDYCYNNETYRRYSERIAERIGAHFGRNPYVIGFQIDNEPAQEGTGRCTCPVCREKFHLWLEKKYGTIAEFNRRSCAVFWSQEYERFDQIPIPVNTIEVNARQQIDAFHENPTVRLDFERFCSDSQIEYQDIQAQALRRHTDRPVTTNATGLATNSIDACRSARGLDVYAFDYYPRLRYAQVSSFPYAFARGVKGDGRFWLLEFMAGGGHCLGGTGRIQPNPGALQLAAVHAAACGAQMLLHFQFRTFPGGAEQLNYAIVDMDGVPRRRYFEMQRTAALLRRLESLLRSEFRNEVAVCVDAATHWSLRIKPVNRKAFDYLSYCGRIYRRLHDIGVNADVVPYSADFSRYKAVIVPSGFVFPAEMQQKCRAYVEKGGSLLATFLTGVKNGDNVGYTESLPAGLRDVFGVTVEEVEPVLPDTHTPVRLAFAPEETCPDGVWSELLAGDADPLGVYAADYKKGHMVLAAHAFGKGRAYYMGTDLPDGQLEKLLARVCDGAGVHRFSLRPAAGPRGMEAVTRYLDGLPLYFVFNFTAADPAWELEQPMADCLTGEVLHGRAEVPAGSFRILRPVPAPKA